MAPCAAAAAGVAVLRIVGAVASWSVVAFIGMWLAFDFLRDTDANRLLVVVVAIVGGGRRNLLPVLGHGPGWSTCCPAVSGRASGPTCSSGPALVILAVFLVYPVINTIIISFKDARRRQSFVGLRQLPSSSSPTTSMLRSIRNTALWIVLVPLSRCRIGLVFATLADRLRRGEAIAKSLIFLPMAISFVGAAVTWRLDLQLPARGLRHQHRPAQRDQAGPRAGPGGVAVAAAVEQPSC